MKKKKNRIKIINISKMLQIFAATTSDSSDISPEMKSWYKTRLLDNATPELIMEQGLQKVAIPKNNGKKIEFRRPVPFPAVTAALTEGQLPAAQNLKIDKLEAQISQYGAYGEYTDMVATTTVDPLVTIWSEENGSQAGSSRDLLVRTCLISGTNVNYAPKISGATETEVTSRAELDGSCRATVKRFREIWAKLAQKNTPKINGDYIAKIHPMVAKDIMQDEQWQDAYKYAKPDNILNGEIGKIAGIRFVMSSNAKIYAPEIISGSFNRFTCKIPISTSSNSIVVNEVVPNIDCFDISTNKTCEVYINGKSNTVKGITYGDSGATLTIGTAITSLAAGDIICGKGAGKFGHAVYSTIIHGANAAAVCDLEGQGIEFIHKPLGYNDALNLVGSLGWKFSIANKILCDAYMVRCESTSSESLTAAEN